PCLCPIMIAVPVKGTFVLTPTGFDGLFNTYAVSDVNWLVSIGGTNAIVTGSGTYKFGGEFALQQQLSLDLQVGGDKAHLFDRGLVPGGGNFPRIDILTSISGAVCFDTVIDIHAAPVVIWLTKGSLNTSNNFFQMRMSGPSGSDVVVEASANLQAWTPVQT